MKFKIKKLLSSPPKTLALGFLMLILIGTILLSLPISMREKSSNIVLDAFFTSTSAVCVTGLIVQNTASHWTAFGKAVILMLIQVGGIGFMTVATSFFIFSGKRVSLRERLIIKEQFNSNQRSGIVRLSNRVIKYTVIIEVAGAILLSLYFVPKFGIRNGIIYSIFHSISAFCNAGFDILGNSLIGYNEAPIVIYTLSFLVILGGIGFSFLREVYEIRKFKKFSLHTKLVLQSTGVLLFIGFVLFILLEFNNGATIKNLSWFGKINATWFQAVVPRTAGFQSVNYSLVKDSTLLVTIILMFIGASPGGTGGGVKTTTIAVIVASVISVVKGSDDTEIFDRRIENNIIKKALAIFTVALLLVLIASFTITVLQPNIRFIDVLFEVTSAFGTVGLGVGVSDHLHVVGKLILCFIMYVGRLGPLTLLYTINIKQKHKSIRLAQDDVIVG